MSYNNCMHKTESAFAAVLGTVATAQSLELLKGLDRDNKSRKSITVVAEASEPFYAGTANRNVTVAVMVRTNMDDFTEAQHREFVREVFDDLEESELGVSLTAAESDFTCFFVDPIGEQQQTVDRSHETTTRYICHVAPSDIA